MLGFFRFQALEDTGVITDVAEGVSSGFFGHGMARPTDVWQNLFPRKFRRLVLGCIEAGFLRSNARWNTLAEIYRMRILLHLSKRKMSLQTAYQNLSHA